MPIRVFLKRFVSKIPFFVLELCAAVTTMVQRVTNGWLVFHRIQPDSPSAHLIPDKSQQCTSNSIDFCKKQPVLKSF